MKKGRVTMRWNVRRLALRFSSAVIVVAGIFALVRGSAFADYISEPVLIRTDPVNPPVTEEVIVTLTASPSEGTVPLEVTFTCTATAEIHYADEIRAQPPQGSVEEAGPLYKTVPVPAENIKMPKDQILREIKTYTFTATAEYGGMTGQDSVTVVVREPTCADLFARKAELENELAALNKQLSKLEAEKEKLEAERDNQLDKLDEELAKEIFEIDKKIEDLTFKIEKFQETLKVLDDEIRKISSSILKLEKSLKNQKIAEVIRVLTDSFGAGQEIDDVLLGVILDIARAVGRKYDELQLVKNNTKLQNYVSIRDKVSGYIQEIITNLKTLKVQQSSIKKKYIGMKTKIEKTYNEQIESIKVKIDGIKQIINQTLGLLKAVKEMIAAKGCQ